MSIDDFVCTGAQDQHRSDIFDCMKLTLLLTVFLVLLSGSTLGQMRVIYPEGAKALSAPLPTFPVESQKLIYGNEVRVLLAIDEQGKVKGALVHGPLAPCSDLSDPVVELVKNAALTAAKATTFEPILKDGKPAEEHVSIGYRLRPRVSPLPEEERRIVSIGVANGRTISQPKPKYPESVTSAGLAVSIQILVDETGTVISAGQIAGDPQFLTEAVIAACGARFSPMKLESKPAKMSGTLVYNFPKKQL